MEGLHPRGQETHVEAQCWTAAGVHGDACTPMNGAHSKGPVKPGIRVRDLGVTVLCKRQLFGVDTPPGQSEVSSVYAV